MKDGLYMIYGTDIMFEVNGRMTWFFSHFISLHQAEYFNYLGELFYIGEV